ncbi:MAG: hypothetical protein QHH10_04640 [Peptococcaceae bacterium]|jgi:hypothetical protein|nr:hypothetical protein [Peptococcaceae bacterium]MDH7524585.1 hypothetical protein [Peptococcaceae bacterium]
MTNHATYPGYRSIKTANLFGPPARLVVVKEGGKTMEDNKENVGKDILKISYGRAFGIAFMILFALLFFPGVGVSSSAARKQRE